MLFFYNIVHYLPGKLTPRKRAISLNCRIIAIFVRSNSNFSNEWSRARKIAVSRMFNTLYLDRPYSHNIISSPQSHLLLLYKSSFSSHIFSTFCISACAGKGLIKNRTIYVYNIYTVCED